ncbi:hypothetical protein M9458_036697, partial [Cirrhinus mrigala]
MSGEGPRESLAAYVEWVLVSCNSLLTVDFADDNTSPTLDQSPANYHPDLWSMSQSPEHPTSHRQVERQSCGSPRSQSPSCPTRCESQLHHMRRWDQWSVRGLWRAPPTAPLLR